VLCWARVGDATEPGLAELDLASLFSIMPMGGAVHASAHAKRLKGMGGPDTGCVIRFQRYPLRFILDQFTVINQFIGIKYAQSIGTKNLYINDTIDLHYNIQIYL